MTCHAARFVPAPLLVVALWLSAAAASCMSGSNGARLIYAAEDRGVAAIGLNGARSASKYSATSRSVANASGMDGSPQQTGSITSFHIAATID